MSLKRMLSKVQQEAAFFTYHSGSIAGPFYTVVPDVRVFALYGLFNGVLGYDFEIHPFMSRERLMLRKDLAERLSRVDPRLVREWRAFHARTGRDTWAWLCCTVLLGAPPRFEPGETPPGMTVEALAEELVGFHEVLAAFYRACGLERLFFSTYKPMLLRLAGRYDPSKMTADRDLVHAYTRFPPERFEGLDLRIVPIPFDSHRVAYTHRVGEAWYLFDGPGISSGGLNRHEYLHMIVDPEVEEYFPRNPEPFAGIFRENLGKEWVRAFYPGLCRYLCESFVRAADHRLSLRGASSAGREESNVRAKTALEEANGLVLVGWLVERLAERFEGPAAGGRTIGEFIGEEILSFDPGVFAAWRRARDA